MSFGLPASTEFNKKIPKQKFYNELSVKSAIKRIFIDNISAIYWRNKLAQSTINLVPGRVVKEVEFFELILTDPDFHPQTVLQLLDKSIKYHIIFILRFEDKCQAWGAYKEPAQAGKNAFNIVLYYHTPWMPEESLPLKIEGLDLDSVYENFIRQIAGSELTNIENEPLKQSVERNKKCSRIEKEIAALESKRDKELQFKIKVEINKQIRELKEKLKKLSNGD